MQWSEWYFYDEKEIYLLRVSILVCVALKVAEIFSTSEAIGSRVGKFRNREEMKAIFHFHTNQMPKKFTNMQNFDIHLQ